MNKALIIFIISASIFSCTHELMAWSDDVSGVLMPEPRGGGGISDREVEGAVNPLPRQNRIILRLKLSGSSVYKETIKNGRIEIA